jgi:hypothetical protein
MPLQTALADTRDFLDGKKTYIVGILMILLGYFTEDTTLMLEGFGFITLRAGVQKSTS